MSKRPDTWMPLYIGDYLRDTGRLTTEGHGAYLLLIMDYWTSGAPLPDDDDQLAAITKLPPRDWKRLRPVIGRYFEIGNGAWAHKRIDAEMAKAAAKTEKRAQAGKRGGEAAAANRQQNGSNATPELLANGQQNDTPSPSPSSSLRSEPTRGARPAFDEAEFQSWWEIYPEKKAKPEARKAFAGARKKIGFDDLMTATLRYADRLRRPGAPHPKYPQGWLNGERWIDEQESPSTVTPMQYDPDAQWRGRLRGWRKDGFWRREWGAPPGEPDCEVPRSLLDDAAA